VISIPEMVYKRLNCISQILITRFVGTRNPEFIATFGKEQISNPLSAGAVLITKDNKLILGRRSSSIDGSKYALSVIAGYLDP
jgi:hypothetical protein